MRDLKLSCDWHEPDYMTVTESETVRTVIDIDEEQQKCRIILDKEKAAKLRDWLNEFLGESSQNTKLTTSAPDLHHQLQESNDCMSCLIDALAKSGHSTIELVRQIERNNTALAKAIGES